MSDEARDNEGKRVELGLDVSGQADPGVPGERDD